MKSEVFMNVPMVIASNPVAKAIERAKLQKWQDAVEREIFALQDGESCGSLLQGVSEVIGMAMRATEDCDDPADIRGTMTEALRRLAGMAEAGGWEKDAAPLIAEATDYAAQLVRASSAKERLQAWAHVMTIQAQAVGVTA